jgi:hypothetical protein
MQLTRKVFSSQPLQKNSKILNGSELMALVNEFIHEIGHENLFSITEVPTIETVYGIEYFYIAVYYWK